MKRYVFVLVASFVSVLSLAAQPPAPAGREPSWAFPAINGSLPAEEASPKSLPGSSKQYTAAQIDDGSNPPDWFPNQHPAAPSIVVKGHGPALACGSCELMS